MQIFAFAFIWSNLFANYTCFHYLSVFNPRALVVLSLLTERQKEPLIKINSIYSPLVCTNTHTHTYCTHLMNLFHPSFLSLSLSVCYRYSPPHALRAPFLKSTTSCFCRSVLNSNIHSDVSLTNTNVSQK